MKNHPIYGCIATVRALAGPLRNAGSGDGHHAATRRHRCADRGDGLVSTPDPGGRRSGVDGFRVRSGLGHGTAIRAGAGHRANYPGGLGRRYIEHCPTARWRYRRLASGHAVLPGRIVGGVGAAGSILDRNGGVPYPDGAEAWAGQRAAYRDE